MGVCVFVVLLLQYCVPFASKQKRNSNTLPQAMSHTAGYLLEAPAEQRSRAGHDQSYPSLEFRHQQQIRLILIVLELQAAVLLSVYSGPVQLISSISAQQPGTDQSWLLLV